MGIKDLKDLLNKQMGGNFAHDLTKENPTEVKDWIPTGSRWLDSIICKGQVAGIPVGKWTEIAGLEATGKSYMAAQIAANAQKKNIGVVYFDSESSIDPAFLTAAGCDLDSLLYVFSVRSLRTPLWRTNPFSNRYLVLAVLGGLTLQLVALYIPFLRDIFHLVHINLLDWVLILGLALMKIIGIETVKHFFITTKSTKKKRK